MRQTVRLLGPATPDDLAIRQAAWVARCVGRGQSVPLRPDDLGALAASLTTRAYPPGGLLFRGGTQAEAVWIIRQGRVELSVGTGRARAVIGVLRRGDVDGDIQQLLDMPMPYTARTLEDATVLTLGSTEFDTLLNDSQPIARRWLSSIALRLAASQQRVIGLLGRSLTSQVARLLLEEAVDGMVPLPQRTLAAMLGAQRPSLNKILKDLERQGLIEVRYGAVDIINPTKLLHITE
ncbi:Crp/Fnr family transcriptional regulator [Pseudonocardia nigra]|uniref:Crp/Fnr family transcriptional regulator n=1 Tax=Pseudonocardia nigra TaxID=1921578 RepID=UPI001C5DE7CE|nr:Crp/Fnr family transcriptional regulator [Pseudonocardia nigra]